MSETTDQPIDLLRISTAGSVDDGKSTLIGRLLYDSKSLFDDQIEALDRDFDLARLTDGLRAEREQGITIDVAYRYFATPSRRFIVADCPGHIQYTRNAVTGMSTSDLSILLVDVRHGVVDQTRRHAFLARMLGLPHLVFCVNKMDTVDWAPDAFKNVEVELRALLEGLSVSATSVRVIPMSALHGDNVVTRSARSPWYDGPSLMQHLETVALPATGVQPARFPVQVVLRPRRSSGLEGRLYAGQLTSGTLSVGDRVVVLPSQLESRITSMTAAGYDPVSQATAPMSIAIGLEDDIDVSRGDLVAMAGEAPAPSRGLGVAVTWMSDRAIRVGNVYAVKAGAQTTRVKVQAVESRLHLERLEHEAGVPCLDLNDIGQVVLETFAPVMVDRFEDIPGNGRLIFIDPSSKDTVGAGLVTACHSTL